MNSEKPTHSTHSTHISVSHWYKYKRCVYETWIKPYTHFPFRTHTLKPTEGDALEHREEEHHTEEEHVRFADREPWVTKQGLSTSTSCSG